MKRALLLLLCLLLLLQGCSAGGIYARYRKIDKLLVVQTLGIDALPGGKIRLSICASNLGDTPPVRLAAEAATLSEARQTLEAYSHSEELLFSHVSHILVGEETARTGLAPYIDYVARSVELRIDTPVLVVKGDEASRLVLGAGDDKSDLSAILDSLLRASREGGYGRAYTIADAVRTQSDGGSPLFMCLSASREKTADSGAEEGELTALAAGYAFFSDLALAGFVPLSLAHGVGLFSGDVGFGAVSVPAEGKAAAVSLDGGSADITASFSPDGRIEKIKIAVRLTAALIETGGGDPEDGAFLPALEKNLTAMAKAWAQDIVFLVESSACDFINLGRALEQKYPAEYRAMPDPLSKQLADGKTQFIITADAKISRSFDLSADRGGAA